MDENELLETLMQSSVLTEVDDGAVQLSTEFESHVTNYLDEITSDTAEITDIVTQVGIRSRHVAGIASAATEDPEFVARYLAIQDLVDDLEFAEGVRVLLLLDQITNPASRTSGSPEPFLSVRGEQLPVLLTIFPLSIVYIWRDECPECDVMRDALETAFDGGHDQFTLLSVYGPACAELLENRYEVVGGPTTLFVVDREVDCRLQGAHVQDVIEKEISNSAATAEMKEIL